MRYLKLLMRTTIESIDEIGEQLMASFADLQSDVKAALAAVPPAVPAGSVVVAQADVDKLDTDLKALIKALTPVAAPIPPVTPPVVTPPVVAPPVVAPPAAPPVVGPPVVPAGLIGL